MARNAKVISVPVAELEDRLCELDGGWAPLVFDFTTNQGVLVATVVLQRVVRQIPMAAPPPDFRIRQ